MLLPTLFETFIRERQLLSNVTPDTLSWHRDSWRVFSRELSAQSTSELTESSLKTATMVLAARRSATGVNTVLRSMNAFLVWLHAEGYTTTRLRIPKLKEPKVTIATLKLHDVQAIIKWKPTTRENKRLQVFLFLLLDCGLRLREARELNRSHIDWDQSTVSVTGKGRRDRTVPISKQMRRHLWTWLKSHEHETVFPDRNGAPLKTRYVHHAMRKVRATLGISNSVRWSPHTLRHTFAVSYLRAGGDVFRLQRILGHSTLEMTRRYVNLQTADLTAVHDRFSPLSATR